jgi:tRNA A-37 threonylcarbamoyl transferase component Bud32
MLFNTGSTYADKLSDIIRGVCYLHNEGFVHGDLRAVRVYVFEETITAD